MSASRILVVGVPRSGTTLVQSLLAAHGSVASCTESHFFSRHFRPLPRLRSALLTRDPTPRLRAFLVENGIGQEEAGVLARQIVGGVGGPLLLRGRAVARRFLALLDALCRRRGRTCWVEKTPRHLRFVPFVEALSQGVAPVRFVHVVRDGVEVVASLRAASRNWQRPYDLDSCVRRWNADVAFSAARLGHANDRFVLYEQLTAAPEAAARRLLADLDLNLAWQPDVLVRRAAAAAAVVAADEPWKHGVGGAIRPSATSAAALTAAERRRVDGALRREPYAAVRDALAAPAGGGAGAC